MKIKKTAFILALAAAAALILSLPAIAAWGEDYFGDLTIMGAVDAEGSIICARPAVVVSYDGDLAIAVTDIDILSDDASSFTLILAGERVAAELAKTDSELGTALFRVDGDADALGVAHGYYPTSREKLRLHYYRSGGDSMEDEYCEIRLTKAKVRDDGTYTFDYELIGKLGEEYDAPMSVLDGDGSVVAVMTPTGEVHSLIFDEEVFGAEAIDVDTNSDAPDVPDDETSDEKGSGAGVSVTVRDGNDMGDILVVISAVLVTAAVVVILLRHRADEQAPDDLSPPETRDARTRTRDAQGAAPFRSEAEPAVMTGRLVLVAADGRRYELTDEPVRIGRGEGCRIRLDDASSGVSREHCTVTVRDGVVMLVDNGSVYGTFLQGFGQLEAGKAVPIRRGDVFYLGDRDNSFMLD